TRLFLLALLISQKLIPFLLVSHNRKLYNLSLIYKCLSTSSFLNEKSLFQTHHHTYSFISIRISFKVILVALFDRITCYMLFICTRLFIYEIKKNACLKEEPNEEFVVKLDRLLSICIIQLSLHIFNSICRRKY